MIKTNFEKLKVYQLAENLADAIWDIVIKWNSFAKRSCGIFTLTNLTNRRKKKIILPTTDY